MFSEAKCLQGLPEGRRPPVVVSGIGAERAAGAASRLIEDGAPALISFGIAGGLDPAIGPGEVIVSDAVVAPDGTRYPSPPDWVERMLALTRGQGVGAGTIAGSERSVVTAEAKRALGEATGAIAVDMESHAIAEKALEAGVPFLAIRAVADGQGRGLPKWLGPYVGGDGSVDHLGIVLAALVRPWRIGALLALAGDSRRAHVALRRVAFAAAPGFGFD